MNGSSVKPGRGRNGRTDVRVIPWSAVAAAAALAAAVTLAPNRDKLSGLQEDIRRNQADLRKAETTVDATTAGIHDLDRRLEDIDRTLVEIGTEKAETSGRLISIQTDLTEAENELAARQSQLARHLRLVYKLGRYPMVKLLVSADEMSDVVRRVRFTLALAREDRRLTRAVGRKRDEIRRDRDAVQDELDYLKELEKLNLKQMDVARGRRDHKRKILTGAKSKRDVLKKRLRELKAEKAELEDLLRAKAGGRKGGGKGGTKAGGKRPVPSGPDLLARHGKIRGPVTGTVVRRFGLITDDRYDTVTKNDGVDLEAPLGAEVKAVLKGKVIFADWFRGYGKLMIVDHGSGYTSVYAHLGTFTASPGEAVSEGQAIATVGDTGYVANPTLHFEIRRDGVALDPLEWMK